MVIVASASMVNLKSLTINDAIFANGLSIFKGLKPMDKEHVLNGDFFSFSNLLPTHRRLVV